MPTCPSPCSVTLPSVGNHSSVLCDNHLFAFFIVLLPIYESLNYVYSVARVWALHDKITLYVSVIICCCDTPLCCCSWLSFTFTLTECICFCWFIILSAVDIGLSSVGICYGAGVGSFCVCLHWDTQRHTVCQRPHPYSPAIREHSHCLTFASALYLQTL